MFYGIKLALVTYSVFGDKDLSKSPPNIYVLA